MEKEYSVEYLLSRFGKSGSYQWKQHVLHFYVAFLSGLHMFSLTFIAPTPMVRCRIPEVDKSHFTPASNLVMTPSGSISFGKDLLSPFIPVRGDGELESCRRYVVPHSDKGNVSDKTTESCNGQFVYDTSIYQQSRVYDWDMVCENKWKRSFIQSIYVLGVFSGALLCGSLSDRYGRKIVLCVSGVLQFIFAIVQPHINNFPLYSLSLYFYGMFGSAGAYITAFVLTMELVHKERRAFVGALFNSSFAIGASFVAIYGYFIRDITILQTIYALHSLPLFGYWWLIDESIRWLWSQDERRTKEALNLVNKGIIKNGGRLSIPNNYKVSQGDLPLAKEPQSDFGLSDLFRLPIMRGRVIITAFNWFAISLCFYGLAFNTGTLPGDPYLVFFLLALADLPGFLLVVLLVNRTGRRPLNATFLFLGGLACIVTTLIPSGFVVTMLAVMAKVALAGSFAVVYNYTAELFPTVVRNSAMGLCTMSSRLGGTLTPQITLLSSLDKSIPPIVFGVVAVCASFAGLFLPETLNKELPQTLEDGEKYGIGDTGFTCFGTGKSGTSDDEDLTKNRRSVAKMLP